MPGKKQAFLRLHLLSGGQRVLQLARLKNEDIKKQGFSLEDPKGRGKGVRTIFVPFLPATREALQELRCTKGEYALSVTPGKHLSASAISAWTKDVVGDAIEGFTLKRVRSGVTTLLAKLGVPKEIRDQLQSHGLASVDNRHYNLYEYYTEKKSTREDVRIPK